MEKSDPQEDPPPLMPETSFSSVNPSPSKSNFSYFFPKFLFLAFLLLLPLSPGRAPEFINQTIFAQFWEFLHILFFGIAVSYGLLSRRNRNVGTQVVSSQNYFSGFLHFPSVSEQNSVMIRLDEKTRIETWKSSYLPPRSMEMSVLSEGTKPRSEFEYKPLGLPIRSLRSTKVNQIDDIQESSDHQRSSSSSDSVSSVEMEKERVKGLVPVNLEKKFKEASAIPWKRRSERIKKKKKKMNMDESESFWSSVLSENSPLPDSPKTDDLDGRPSLKGKSVRTIRTKNMYEKTDVKGRYENGSRFEPFEEEMSSGSTVDGTAINGGEEEGDDDDDDDDGKEVDKKADEFIAKFREQIRLQKINSARGFKHW